MNGDTPAAAGHAPRAIETAVLVVGAGPVGLTAAMQLAHRGNDVVVIEQRGADVPASAKCNHISARTMEIYRRLDVADAIRAEGLPDDFPNDGVYATRLTGYELTRFRMPCRRDRFDDHGYDDGDLPSPERAARVSQLYLEPVLRRHLRERFSQVPVLHETRFTGFEQHDDHVISHAVREDTGEELEIRSRYVIGADGASSSVRKALGLRLRGDDNLTRARTRLFRAPDLLSRFNYPRAWMNWFIVDDIWSSLIAIDGEELWNFHCFMPPTREFADLDLDKALRDALGVGPDFTYETVRDEDWIGRRLVAGTFQVGRVFLSGDAAHLWVPYGGYGMNAGIADVANLAWMMDAVLQGWAPESLLTAHDAERRPVTEQVSAFASNFVEVLQETESEVIEEDSAAGAAARRAFGQRLRDANIRSMVPTGLNFGYAYGTSPIVVHDGEEPPPFTMGDYQPSTAPGARLPHFWFADGESLYDALPDGFTLLRFDDNVDVAPLAAAAAERSVPLRVINVDPAEDVEKGIDLADLGYRHALVLARPDQHVAWRGAALPPDPGALLDQVRGAVTAQCDRPERQASRTLSR
ncbi:FAD-dependent oxidoreductase [Amycolatopsis tolypomycina]|uniref:2-polyprenyl-6-methoxyphenol hydroxylase n=1 Tax=Amycolatopsis tolypomycina TaxID=208445 RepID=A0A1H4Y3K3_9PSEU|nr:FAD-dependent oxidoreductase [Amycolatopsis tolypomycina]SED12295.1 2-polyprenyl-6-methoxyphenol hydroxylase [Amycolatopsis tolypomycina]